MNSSVSAREVAVPFSGQRIGRFDRHSHLMIWNETTSASSVATSQSGLPLTVGKSSSIETVQVPAKSQLLLKRSFDVVFAVVALIVFAPLLLLVAALIKLTSPGPVFFVQPREGLNGALFNALKFRSMRQEQADLSGVKQTVENDPRVTLIGRFIRKTSIDELPQLFNVLRGDMSVVGPRPHVPGMLAAGMLYTDLVPYYRYRLAMRPGITGWAQANGYRGPTTDAANAKARVDHDIAYIQNFSIWLDLKVILRTAKNEFLSGSGH